VLVLVVVLESKHISLYEHEDDDEDDLSNRDDDPLPDFFSGIELGVKPSLGMHA
jgi:hypothetical protein